MSPANCPSEHDLRAFQLGDLPEPALNDVAEHLEHCPQCETVAQKLDTEHDAILAAISRSTPTPPREVTQILLTPVSVRELTGAPPDNDFSFLLPPAQPDEIGRLGDYRVLRLLGKGGMAFIFQAEDLALRRPVALKVMKPDLSGDPEGWQRFLREARIMAAIKHDHLATVYQAKQEGRVVYLAMELLVGETLGDRIGRKGASPTADVLRLGREIASGLEVVHGHGLVHRDVKPDNIWLESPGERVKILDFGLARFVHDDARLTQTGTVMGTPSFMAPEQARGETADARSDLFSLGCVLYCLCTGRGPFHADNTMAALTMLAVQTPKPVHEVNPAVPRPLSDLVMQLLEKDPALRPTSATEVIERLRQIESGQVSPSPAPPPSADRPLDWRRAQVAALAAAVVLVALLAFTFGRSLFGPQAVTATTQPTTPAVVSTQPTTPAVVSTQPTKPEKELFPLYAAVPGATYLSELNEIDVIDFPIPKGVKQPPGTKFPELAHWPPAKGGVRVVINGKYSLRGIWMHLPPTGGPVSISYALGKQYSTFHCQVTLNDGPPECPPLTFRVSGDGKVLWQSTPVKSQEDTQTCKVSVKGVEKLTLNMSSTRDPKGTHGAWIEPHLLK